jgi:hypothetical protein
MMLLDFKECLTDMTEMMIPLKSGKNSLNAIFWMAIPKNFYYLKGHNLKLRFKNPLTFEPLASLWLIGCTKGNLLFIYISQ